MLCRADGGKSAVAGATVAMVAAGRSVVMARDLSLVAATSAVRSRQGTLALK
jgi:hypothetical protein